MQFISSSLAQAFAEAVFASINEGESARERPDLQLSGIDLEARQVPVKELSKLFMLAQKMGASDDIGLLAYDNAHPGNLDFLGYAIMSSSTISDALKYIVDFHSVVSSGFCMYLDRQGSTLKLIGFAENSEEPELPRPFIDAAASITLGLLHWLAPRQKIMPLCAEFTYDEPGDTTQLKKLFGPNLKFRSEVNALTFKREDGDLPIATGNVLLQAIHNDYLAMQQNTINIDNVSARTKSTVLQHLCQNRPVAIEDIAHTMQLTPYQLTKALEPEGQNVKKLVDQVKMQQSHQLLTTSILSLKQISYRVAFKNQSAFNKACERWFGMSPGRYRASKSQDEE